MDGPWDQLGALASSMFENVGFYGIYSWFMLAKLVIPCGKQT